MNRNDKKFVELLWTGKFDRFDLGEKVPIERPNLPFQVVETVNEPRIKEIEGTLLEGTYYPFNSYCQKIFN